MIPDITVPFTFHAGAVALPTEVNANNSVIQAKISELIAALNGMVDGVPAMWVSGEAYSAGVTVWSPTDFKTYRAKVNLAESTVDPHDEYLGAAIDWDLQSYTKDAATLGGFPPSQTPVQGQVPVVKSDSSTALPGGVSVGNVSNAGATVFDWYEEGTFTGTATGFTTTPTGTCSFIRLGKAVVLSLPASFTGTSNLGSFTVTGMPSNIRPAATRYITVRTADNGGALIYSFATISNSGVITVFNGPAAASNFAAAGTKTLSPQDDIFYQL